MTNKGKDIDVKNRTYYFFDDIINTKNFDPNNIEINEKSYENIFIYYIGYVTIKDHKYLKINSVNPLYLFFCKVNEYFQEINKNKYLMLLSANESKEKIKKYEEFLSKIRDLIRLIARNSDDYNEKYMKIKFNSDDELPLNKTKEIPSMIMVLELFFMKIANIIHKFS